MNNRLSKFAPAGFYLAVLAALVSLGLIIIRQKFDLYLQGSLGMILIGLALFVLFDPNRARDILTGRQAKYSSNAIVLSLAVVGILVVANYFVNNHSIRWDLTEDKDNTLSVETLDILNRLPEKVTALAFFTPNISSSEAAKLLENYKYNGKGNFDYKFIDPDADPVTAKSAAVTRDGTIVLQMAGRQEQVTYADEQEISSALIRLANPGSRAVYFLTGHGELDLSGSGERTINYLKTDLESKNYSVKPLNLLNTNTIPDDALAIIIDQPMKPLTQAEVDLLSGYLKSGKSLVLLMEPRVLTNYGDAKDPLEEYLKSTWGIAFNNDLIIDPKVNPPLAAVADSYGNHLITQKMQGMVTIFPSAFSLTAASPSPDVTTAALVQTGQDSWGETDYASIEQNNLAFDQQKDLPGPLTVAIAAENAVDKSRLVVISDSDFASDADFLNYGNGVFIDNSIDWAAKQDNLVQLTSRAKTQRVILPPQTYTMGLVLFGSVFLIPLLILFSGIVVFIQRRRRS